MMVAPGPAVAGDLEDDAEAALQALYESTPEAKGFGYALFFMTDAALDYVGKTGGLEIGVGPSLVVVDQGMARTLTSTTVRSDVYAFTFGQKGLMAGAGLQGSKITRITP